MIKFPLWIILVTTGVYLGMIVVGVASGSEWLIGWGAGLLYGFLVFRVWLNNA